MSHFAVVGVTSWGVTLAWLLARSGHDIALVARDEEEAARTNHARSLPRLPLVTLPANVTAVTPETMPAVEGYVSVVPTQSTRATLQHPAFDHAIPVLCASKGIELASGEPPSVILASLGWRPRDIAALSGPNLAHEIARGAPAAAVVAARDEVLAARWQSAFTLPTFRVYRTADITGVEVAGALKNVIAIAVGASFGLEFGANTAAAIVTRGLAEMTRIGVALGADPLTFQGLAGVGDLAATCFSPLSRNRRLGELLARGSTPAAALAEIGEVAEGAATAPVAERLAASLDVEAPITNAVAAVLAGRATVPEVMAGLLSRGPRTEEFARF